MPPKRRSTGATAKLSQQSTLAFHGASNKVTKPGARKSNAKKNVAVDSVEKDLKPDVLDIRVKDEDEHTTAEAAIIEQTEQVQEQTKSTPEEEAAKQITTRKLQEWLKKQNTGKAPRAHQEDLSLEEKILRKFDTSGQYGPCVGIARLKRWQRAHSLDLEPPIEVLAVLLKEQEDKDKLSVQKSIVDEILNSRVDAEV